LRASIPHRRQVLHKLPLHHHHHPTAEAELKASNVIEPDETAMLDSDNKLKKHLLAKEEL
jgi:hypothetical protein